MPADGISLLPKKGGLRHVPLGRLERQVTSTTQLDGRGMTAFCAAGRSMGSLKARRR
jgi:hypothetical protein